MMKCTLVVLFVSTFAMSACAQAFANNMTNSTNATPGGNYSDSMTEINCEAEEAQACTVLINAYDDKCGWSVDDFNMMSVEEIKNHEYPPECDIENQGK